MWEEHLAQGVCSIEPKNIQKASKAGSEFHASGVPRRRLLDRSHQAEGGVTRCPPKVLFISNEHLISFCQELKKSWRKWRMWIPTCRLTLTKASLWVVSAVFSLKKSMPGQASQNYVNRMWENLLLAFIGEAGSASHVDTQDYPQKCLGNFCQQIPHKNEAPKVAKEFLNIQRISVKQ